MNRDFPHQVREKGNSIEIVLPTPATKNIQQHNVSIKWKFMIFINFIFIFCFWLDARDMYTNGYIGNANTIFIPLLEEIWKTNCFQWTLGCRWDNSVFLLAMFCNLMIFYGMLFLLSMGGSAQLHLCHQWTTHSSISSVLLNTLIQLQ